MMRHDLITGLLAGATLAGYAVCGLFFFRFWRRTDDRLFVAFAVAFWLLGFQRLALTLAGQESESHTGWYLMRLAAFVIILVAVVDKNRGGAGRGAGPA
jgi:uncharacterized membrane protein YeiB